MLIWEEFETAGIVLGSVLHYEEHILPAAKLSSEVLAVLKEWKFDHTGWGEKHGFPRIKKD
ncbi:MAG: hypothetical protein JW791_01550 [Nanoarchaeota archaeon]|nr:hypothetical protein [Nanoarchaeota archaeon]